MTSPARERAVVEAFIGFADRLVEDFDILDLTIQLTEDCARLLDVAAVGLLLADAGRSLHLVAATSEQARSLELFQLQRDEGPCLDCYLSGQPVNVPDLRAEHDRWPRFTAAASEQGFVSIHAVPMRLRDQMLGALGLFGTTPGALSEQDLTLARALAHVACIAVVQQGRASDPANVVPTLQSTVASRRLLEMAKGVLVATYGISMDQAAASMRGHAHRQGRRLTDIAHAVVDVADATHRQLVAELGNYTVPAQPEQQG